MGLRRWFVERLVKQLEDERDALNQASSGGGGSRTQTLTPHNQPKMPSNGASQQALAAFGGKGTKR